MSGHCTAYSQFAQYGIARPQYGATIAMAGIVSMPMNTDEARRMRQIMRLLRPQAVYEITIVESSPDNWMASAVVKDGPDRRFRFQGGKLYDESKIGDMRV